MFIVGLTGKARSGKDYLATELNKSLGFSRHAFADDLKDIYCAGHNIGREELEKYKETHRQGLIDLSENHLKKYNREFFADRFMDKVKFLNKEKDAWIITDFRYREEYQKLYIDENINLVMVEVVWEEHSLEGCGYQLDQVYKNKLFMNTDNKELFELRLQNLIGYIEGSYDSYKEMKNV